MNYSQTDSLITSFNAYGPSPFFLPSLTDDGTVIDIKLGQQFQITLDSNPTTGYQWRFSEDPEGVVKLVKHDYSPSPPQRLGSGGFDHWVFEGVEPGETTIIFEYVRAWEDGVEPVKKVRYEVRLE